MKGNTLTRILAIMLVLLFSTSSAMAEIGGITLCREDDVEEGRSSVPTCEMITWSQQREIVNAWPETGSLAPSSSQSNDCPPSRGNRLSSSDTSRDCDTSTSGSSSSDTDCNTGSTGSTGSITFGTSCPPSSSTDCNTGSGNTSSSNTNSGNSGITCPPASSTNTSTGGSCTTGSITFGNSCPPSSSTDCNTGTNCDTGTTCPPSSGSGSSGSGSSGTDGHYTSGSLTSQEQSLANSVNEERVSRGLSPLVVDTELSAIAREKSTDMVTNSYFAHESPTYGHASDMLDDAGYNYTSVGENIAHAGSVERAHDLLMSSSGHRANILGTQWTKLGVGIVSDRNGYPMITELFAR